MDDARAGGFDQHEDLTELLGRVADLQTRMKKLVDMANQIHGYASEFVDPFAEDYDELYSDELALADYDESELDQAAAFEFGNDWEEAIYPFEETPEAAYREADGDESLASNQPLAEEILVRHVPHYREWPPKLQTGYAPSDITPDQAAQDVRLDMIQEIDVYDATEIAAEALEPMEWMDNIKSAYRSVQNFAHDIEVVQTKEFSPRQEPSDDRVDALEVSVELASVPAEPSDEMLETKGTSDTSAVVADDQVVAQELNRDVIENVGEIGQNIIQDVVQAVAQHETDVTPQVESRLAGVIDQAEIVDESEREAAVTGQVAETRVEEAEVEQQWDIIEPAGEPTVSDQGAPEQAQEAIASEERKKTEGQTGDRQESKESGVIRWNRFPPPLSRRHRG